jgi:hypothetical protein
MIAVMDERLETAAVDIAMMRRVSIKAVGAMYEPVACR